MTEMFEAFMKIKQGVTMADESKDFERDMNTHLYTILNVAENPIEINDRAYATVNDTIKGFNIQPFTGNCQVPASGAEAERIMLWQDFGIVDGKQLSQAGVKGGVCQCLMNLNEQWDNMFF